MFFTNRKLKMIQRRIGNFSSMAEAIDAMMYVEKLIQKRKKKIKSPERQIFSEELIKWVILIDIELKAKAEQAEKNHKPGKENT